MCLFVSSMCHCLNDCCPVFHVEKKELVKISSGSGLSLDLATVCTAEAD